jgi:hypothetical protein
MVQGFIQPYVTWWPHYLSSTRGTAGTHYPPATAIVEPGNPVGGAFTLPTGFINVTSTYSLTPKTAWPGYTTVVYVDHYNGPGKFGANHGATGPNRIVFPATMGNPYPTYTPTYQKWINGNYGYGDPVTPTTTFDGRYDMSRGGSITVTPGPRRFGGTFRLFHGPNARWEQYIYYFSPIVYVASRHYVCLDEGKFGCTPRTFASDIGDTTAQYQATWYLLTASGKFRATTPTTPYGKAPTPYGNASYLRRSQHYLNLIHPWTTGFAKVHNAKGSGWGAEPITPQAQGYDISLGGADITVTHYSWKKVLTTSGFYSFYDTVTTKQYLKGVTRVLSMVRPRLIHTYTVPIDPAEPIENTWQAARLWRLKVFFLPEPTGMLLLAAGLGCLTVLHRLRRRG